jgi:HSP20 family protein
MAELAEKLAEKERGQMQKAAMPSRALSPFEEMEDMMDRMLGGFFPRPWLSRPRWAELPALFEGKWPHVDVVDREDEVVVRAELPGVEKKDLDVSMGDNTVTIKAATKHEEKEEKGDYYRCEISRGAYTRTVGLPAEVDASKAKAKFKDGLLELTLPKLEKSKRRTITVE